MFCPFSVCVSRGVSFSAACFLLSSKAFSIWSDLAEGGKEGEILAFPVISLQLSHKIRLRTITTVCSRRALVNKSMAWRITLKKGGGAVTGRADPYLLTAIECLAVTGMQAGIKKEKKMDAL